MESLICYSRPTCCSWCPDQDTSSIYLRRVEGSTILLRSNVPALLGLKVAEGSLLTCALVHHGFRNRGLTFAVGDLFGRWEVLPPTPVTMLLNDFEILGTDSDHEYKVLLTPTDLTYVEVYSSFTGVWTFHPYKEELVEKRLSKVPIAVVPVRVARKRHRYGLLTFDTERMVWCRVVWNLRQLDERRLQKISLFELDTGFAVAAVLPAVSKGWNKVMVWGRDDACPVSMLYMVGSTVNLHAVGEHVLVQTWLPPASSELQYMIHYEQPEQNVLLRAQREQHLHIACCVNAFSVRSLRARMLE